MTLTPLTKKIVHAVVAGFVTAGADICAQLASGQLDHATRAVVIGVVVGFACRLAGMVLAAMDESS